MSLFLFDLSILVARDDAREELDILKKKIRMVRKYKDAQGRKKVAGYLVSLEPFFHDEMLVLMSLFVALNQPEIFL